MGSYPMSKGCTLIRLNQRRLKESYLERLEGGIYALFGRHQIDTSPEVLHTDQTALYYF